MGGAPIGVGILSYENVQDVTRCVRSVRFRTRGRPIDMLLYDNSERRSEIKQYVIGAHPSVHYLGDGKNWGCSVGRNRMFADFMGRHPKAKLFAVMDMDVEVLHGWLDAMIAVMDTYPRCAVVGWPLANFAGHKPLPNGCVSEIAGMCCLFRVRALKQLIKAGHGNPWDERFFFHRFDTLLCDRMNQLGWRTHLVMKGYKPGRPRPEQTTFVRHHHPHKGVKSHPRCSEIKLASRKLYNELQQREGWRPFDPRRDPY